MERVTELLAELSALIGRLDEAIVALTTPEEMQRTLDGLALVERNDLRLLREQLRTRLTGLLAATSERAVVVDGVRHRAIPKYRKTWDHSLIEARCASRARYDDDGVQIDDPELTAARAAAMMRACYVTPSTEPRTEGLREVGFETKVASAASKEQIGWEIRTDVPKTTGHPSP